MEEWREEGRKEGRKEDILMSSKHDFTNTAGTNRSVCV